MSGTFGALLPVLAGRGTGFAGAVLPILLAALVAATLLLALTWRAMRREAQLARMLAGVRGASLAAAAPPAGAGAPPSLPARLIAALGRALTGTVLSRKAVVNLEATLRSAGVRAPNGLPLFVGAKALLLVALPVLGWGLLHGAGVSPLWLRLGVAVSAISGMLLPDAILKQVRTRYLDSVERAMPDALDLLVICSEAGLALEAGLQRVSVEIRISSPACATELATTHSELRLLADRRAALINMGQRTGLVSLQRLAGTLVQALQYGTPLSQALRALSADMRAEMLTRFEARAARLPVLMTVPMILFILPCVFLVVGGPALLTLIHTFSGGGAAQ